MLEMLDQWVEGPAYERFMGRWSRRLAPMFLDWLKAPPGLHWLDVGCGTGALTAAICADAAPVSVVGCDPSESFIDYARAQLPDDRVEFVVASAPDLPPRPGGYDSITSLLALNFIVEPAVAVRRMMALTAGPGSVISACVWEYGEQMQMLDHFWRAATAVDPRAREYDERRRFPLTRHGALDSLFRDEGLHDLHCDPLRLRMVFAGFDDYWQSVLGGTGPASTYLSLLDEEHRAELARRLQRQLPGGPQTRITLSARAWAIRGTMR